VTAEITEQTFVWLRRSAFQFHLEACAEQFDSLSLSERQMPLGGALSEKVAKAEKRWPQLEAEIRQSDLSQRGLPSLDWSHSVERLVGGR
jgi:phosphoenolpyruvate carboxylase